MLLQLLLLLLLRSCADEKAGYGPGVDVAVVVWGLLEAGRQGGLCKVSSARLASSALKP
jgi:hypothetical protein